MNSNKKCNRARRAALTKLAAGGMLGAGGFYAVIQQALAANPQQGITHLKGNVSLDGKPAILGQLILPGQRLVTGPDGEAIYIIGKDAFLQRHNSEFAIESDLGVAVLRFIAGKILGVFGKGAKQLRTPTATIGIRGTACYIEAEPERTYFCLCYGEADLAPLADPAQRISLRTQHHERPLYIGNKIGKVPMANAPVLNHTDAELIMLESLVDRKPPFYGNSYPTLY